MPILIIFTSIMILIWYKRYFPVCCIKNLNLKDLNVNNIEVIDVRDYNESYRDPIKGATNIPIAYLNRNIREIPNKTLHLIVSSPLDKNVGTRFLRSKGFKVVGYSIINHNNILIKDSFLNLNQ